MYRIIKIALIALGVLAAVLWVMMARSGEPIQVDNSLMNFMMLITWILLALAAVSALIFGLGKMLTTKGGLKKALFGIGGLVVLAIGGYAMSSGAEAEAVVKVFEGKDIQPTVGTVKNIGMLLNMFFGMTLIAVLLMVVPGVKKLLGR